MKKRLLIISQYYYPDITAAAFRITETVELLAAKGYEITVITAEPHRCEMQGIEEKIENVVVIRLPLIPYSGKGKWDYLLHYLSFMVNAILTAGIKTKGRYDMVLATSPPLFVAAAGRIVSRLKGAKYVLDIRDIWPDSAVVAGQISPRSWLYRVGKVVERRLYQDADLISTVANPMRDYIGQYTNKKNIKVIYNGIAEKYLAGSGGQKDHLFEGKNINVVYLGNMGRVQDLGVAIEAANRIQETSPEVKFYLIGAGVERPRLEKLVSQYELRNVIIKEPVSKDMALRLMRESSALFFQLKDDVTMEKTIPSKVFDYMAAGKPIIFGIKGEGKEILERVKGNIYFKPGSVDSFIEAITYLRNQYDILSKEALNNKNEVYSFTREKMIETLHQALLVL